MRNDDYLSVSLSRHLDARELNDAYYSYVSRVYYYDDGLYRARSYAKALEHDKPELRRYVRHRHYGTSIPDAVRVYKARLNDERNKY